MTELGRYLRTVRQLRPEQLAHRIRLRSQKALLTHVPALGHRLARPLPTTWGWPESFVPLDAQLPTAPGAAEAIGEGRFQFLSIERPLGSPHDWRQADAEQLWRYHLHYFEWAWHLAHHPDREWAAATFERLFRSWTTANPVGRWDAWSPYVTSLRAWALCGVHRDLVAGRPVEQEVVGSLALHASYLRWHLERDVGGNHLLKNLKALVGLRAFLGDTRSLARALGQLDDQLAVQVLPDGGHYERSPSYHAQVLGDLVDLRGLLAAAAVAEPHGLVVAEAAMRRWLEVMLLPDGDVPLFNDCTTLGPLTDVLGVRPAPEAGLTLLADTGYAVLHAEGGMHVVMDVGDPCPGDLPAHAHADTLSFVLSVDGVPVVVDRGTSSYEDRALRPFERGTRAHNTVEVDGADSTEVWGRFRAGRRARVVLHDAAARRTGIEVAASHDGYRALPGAPTHLRRLVVDGASVTVHDEVSGRGRHRCCIRLLLAPGIEPRQTAAGTVIAPPVAIEADRPMRLVPAEAAVGFGDRRRTWCVEIETVEDLPMRSTVVLRRAADGGGAPDGAIASK